MEANHVILTRTIDMSETQSTENRVYKSIHMISMAKCKTVATPFRSVALTIDMVLLILIQLEDILLQETENHHICRIVNMRRWIINCNILNEKKLFIKLTESNYHECLKSTEYTWDDWLNS